MNCEPWLESRQDNTNTKFWGFACYTLSIPCFSTPFLMDVMLIASIQMFSEMVRAWTPQFISDGLPGVCSNWPFRNVLIHVFKLKLQETAWNFRRNLEISEGLILGTSYYFGYNILSEVTLWNLKPSVQGVGWENIQWCNFSNEVAEMWLEFWEIGDVLNSWDSRDGDALGQLWTNNLFKSANSGRFRFSIWTMWKIIFCKLLFQPAVFVYTIWDFNFFFICFSCAHNCLLKHFYNVYALKFLSEFQHLCHLGVELHWLSFLIQPEMSLTLGMMKYFHLCLGHFGYCVMRLWILFKSSVWARLLWLHNGKGRASYLDSVQLGWSPIPHSASADTWEWGGALLLLEVDGLGLPQILLTSRWLERRGCLVTAICVLSTDTWRRERVYCPLEVLEVLDSHSIASDTASLYHSGSSRLP